MLSPWSRNCGREERKEARSWQLAVGSTLVEEKATRAHSAFPCIPLLGSMKTDSVVKSMYVAGGGRRDGEPSRYIPASSFSVGCKIGGILKVLTAGSCTGVDTRHEDWERPDPVTEHHYPFPWNTSFLQVCM